MSNIFQIIKSNHGPQTSINLNEVKIQMEPLLLHDMRVHSNIVPTANFVSYIIHCNIPEVQRNLSPQPNSRGHLLCGTHACVSEASPEHGAPLNWAYTSMWRVRTWTASWAGRETISRYILMLFTDVVYTVINPLMPLCTFLILPF